MQRFRRFRQAQVMDLSQHGFSGKDVQGYAGLLSGLVVLLRCMKRL